MTSWHEDSRYSLSIATISRFPWSRTFSGFASACTMECLDQDGNLAMNAGCNAPTSELSVNTRFTVEMLRRNPFDYVLIGESLN